MYTSTDSGKTWVARAGSQGWGVVSSSSDGAKLVAVTAHCDECTAPAGKFYTSSNAGKTISCACL